MKLLKAVWFAAALLPQMIHGAPQPSPAAVEPSALEGMPAAAAKGPRTLTILDPVNLTTSLPDPESGAMLRKTLNTNPSWRILAGDSTVILLREYNQDPDLPCAEFQCAFDAGNALQTEFVLFGTTTSLPGLHAFTLDLVHVPSSQVVWSRVGEAPKRPGAYRQSRNGLILQGSLSFAVSDLDPAGLNLRRRPSMGLLGVMDAGQSTPHSRVVLHRALSHAYGSRGYDLLGPAEMDELAAALDFRSAPDRAQAVAEVSLANNGVGTAETRTKGAGGTAYPVETGMGFRPGGIDMYELGEKMGVRYLLWTKVENEGGDHKMDLALYDVSGRKLLRHWPAKESSDFNSLLGIEDRFMTVLGNGAPITQVPDAARKSGARTFGKFASIGLAVAAGATLGYLAYQDKQDADREYARFKAAPTQQEAQQAKRNVEEHDLRARQYGLLGGLSLALGAAVWVF